MAGTPPARKEIFFWLLAAIFVALVSVFLFWAEPLFLKEKGAQAQLQASATRLRAGPPGAAVSGVGQLVKSFLDASKHASRMEVNIEEASASWLRITLSLPRSALSEKILRRRGKTTVRLAASLLKSAGATGVGVVVMMRRRGAAAGQSEPVGVASRESGSKAIIWRAQGN
jgi:hypothetical protein